MTNLLIYTLKKAESGALRVYLKKGRKAKSGALRVYLIKRLKGQKWCPMGIPCETAGWPLGVPYGYTL